MTINVITTTSSTNVNPRFIDSARVTLALRHGERLHVADVARQLTGLRRQHHRVVDRPGQRDRRNDSDDHHYDDQFPKGESAAPDRTADRAARACSRHGFFSAQRTKKKGGRPSAARPAPALCFEMRGGRSTAGGSDYCADGRRLGRRCGGISGYPLRRIWRVPYPEIPPASS